MLTSHPTYYSPLFLSLSRFRFLLVLALLLLLLFLLLSFFSRSAVLHFLTTICHLSTTNVFYIFTLFFLFLLIERAGIAGVGYVEDNSGFTAHLESSLTSSLFC